MLVLSRKCTQEIMIGSDIVITVCEFRGDCVRLGITAPDNARILQGELAEAERIARIKADHNTVRCPACLAKTNATADGVDIRYSFASATGASRSPPSATPKNWPWNVTAPYDTGRMSRWGTA